MEVTRSLCLIHTLSSGSRNNDFLNYGMYGLYGMVPYQSLRKDSPIPTVVNDHPLPSIRATNHNYIAISLPQ